jgi:hypothetical protein
MDLLDRHPFSLSFFPSTRYSPELVSELMVDKPTVRPGKPDEFAALVRHGIENVMLNGVVLRLDGGMRMPSKM